MARTYFVLSPQQQILSAPYENGGHYKPAAFEFVIHTTPCLMRFNDCSV